MKAWSGRFQKQTHKKVEEFTNSLPADIVLYAYDIAQSKAYAQALSEAGILLIKDSKMIVRGLNQIQKEIEKSEFEISLTDEDIHMAIEKALIAKIGKPALFLQTGRSRNDQVSTSLRMFLKVEIAESVELITNLQKVLVGIAENNLSTLMPGYTHLQKAQPITLAHHLMAYFWMLERDKNRFAEAFEATDEMPLGSGALSGNPFKINRKKLAKELGFTRITENSLDAVSSRDFILQVMGALAISMTNLSRLAEEIVLWSTDEFGFIELDDAFATGSSLMPQKKNPDVAELIRGKTPMAASKFTALCNMMKGLPLSYNRDMQEDKHLLVETLDFYQPSLDILADMLATTTFNKDRMAQSVVNSYSLATEIADYLVEKGVGFREAHDLSGKLVNIAIKQKTYLNDLTLGQFQKVSPCFDEDVYKWLDPMKAVKRRNLTGGTAPAAVKKQIAKAKELLP